MPYPLGVETAVVIAIVGGLGLALIATILVLSKSKDGGTLAAVPPPEVPPSALTPESLKKRYGRPGFLPETEPGDHGKSHFCGRPWLAEGEAWPSCGRCGEPMQLFLQLDLDALPNGAPAQRSGGLAQLFYCVNSKSECEIHAESWEPFKPATMARVVDPTQPGAQAADDLAHEPFPAQTITGWQELDDLPNWEELLKMDVVMTPEVESYLEEAETPQDGDKLGGWPHWVQGVEYPTCPDCGDPMELLFQLDSEDHVPFMFGDAGVGHLTRCRRHSTKLAFGWACG